MLITETTDAIYNKLESVAGKLTKDNKGYTAKYEEFVMDAFKLWENGYITLSQANKRFSSFTEFVTSADGEIVKKSTDAKNLAGGKLRQKRKIVPAEWRGYFLGDGTKRIDGRRRSLLEALSGEFGADAIEAAIADVSMRARIESVQTEIGVTLVDGYARQLGKLIALAASKAGYKTHLYARKKIIHGVTGRVTTETYRKNKKMMHYGN